MLPRESIFLAAGDHATSQCGSDMHYSDDWGLYATDTYERPSDDHTKPSDSSIRKATPNCYLLALGILEDRAV